ncbi:hypothetical protein ACIP2Y_38835 [Streptomyces sviceus]
MAGSAPHDSMPEEAHITLLRSNFQYRPNEFALVPPASYSS